MKNQYAFAIIIATMGFILMTVESILIKLSNVSGVTYSFYIGILIFVTTNILLAKKSINIRAEHFKSNYKIILISALLMGLSNMFFISAIKHTTVALTVIILSTAPLFATLFTYILYKEKPKKRVYVVSTFTIIGILIIFSKQLGGNSLDTLLGDIFALLCTMCYSLNFVIMSKHTNINRLEVLAFAGLFLALISLALIESFALDKTSFYIILLAGIFVGPISRLFMLIGTKTLPANEVALLSIVESILGPIWAYMILNEVPHINTVIGGTIILLTLVLNSIILIRTSKIKNT